jgi:hypothetical protein
MTAFKTRMTSLALAVAIAALGAIAMVAPVPAADTDDPWPEPPSCSNDTGTCTSMEDMIAYECYMEEVHVGNFCDDPFAELMERDTDSFVAPLPGPDPQPLGLKAPSPAKPPR